MDKKIEIRKAKAIGTLLLLLSNIPVGREVSKTNTSVS